MTDASVDEFMLRDDAETVPTDTTEIELNGETVEVKAELAEDSLMSKIQSPDSDPDYILRRILAKYETPEFPTETEDGTELLAEGCVDDLISKRVDTLLKTYYILNGVDEEAIEMVEEKQREAVKGNLEEMEGGIQVNPEELHNPS